MQPLEDPAYTDKDMAQAIIDKMPEAATLSDIAHRLNMVDAAQHLAEHLIEQGLDEEEVGIRISSFIASYLR